MTAQLNSNRIIVREITLLSMQEYKRFSRLISDMDESSLWWLKTANERAKEGNRVMTVDNLGNLSYFGEICSTPLSIRPTLKVETFANPNFRVSNTVELFGHIWTVLEVQNKEILLLCDEYIGNEIFDEESNDYSQSFIKDWLNGWLFARHEEYKMQRSEE